MSRSHFVACLALLAITAACRSSHRTRRPRVAPPPTATAEVETPPPAPAPAPAPVPAPVRHPAPKPAARTNNGWTCGPGGSGPRFAVHGVEATDTLNVRISPDAKSEVRGQLAADATGVVGMGQPQKIGTSTWRKVRCGELVGWVNERFLDPQGEAPRKSVAKRM
jgi:hypothetical protein